MNTKQNPLKDTMCVIVLSGKGGTGKTTISSLLALELSKNLKTCVTDCDIRAPNIGRVFGVSGRGIVFNEARRMIAPKVNDNLAVFSTELLFKDGLGIRFESDMEKMIAEQQILDVDWGFDKIDVLVADNEPAGIDPLSVFSKLFKGRIFAVLVTTPKGVSIDNTERAISICSQYDVPIIGVVANQVESECSGCHITPVVCENCGLPYVPFGNSKQAIDLCNKYDIRFFGEIYHNPEIGVKMDAGNVDKISNHTSEVIQRIADVVRKGVK